MLKALLRRWEEGDHSGFKVSPGIPSNSFPLACDAALRTYMKMVLIPGLAEYTG